jgi:hypothetical protein
MKWLLFAFSLFSLWVAFNALYMLPGKYTALNFELAGTGIGIGILTAWLSGKRFVEAEPKRPRASLLQSPPVVLCVFILTIFCVIGLFKFVLSR